MSKPEQPFPIVNLTLAAASGVFLNSWARSMARLPLKGNPLSYVAYASVTTGLAYGFHLFQENRIAKAEVEKDKLVKRRMLALEAAE
ncbi:hypothetical protein BDR26DRAFT_935734 [Obelidium mucronatum]|nr:hypothetical protein BDR26DRAFT_935734 [Obelidium mucronatum]